MKTSIRVGKSLFYGDDSFPYGLSRSGHFNKRESDELARYGSTFEGLCDGSLSPINNDEIQFINAMKADIESDLYFVNLWKRYLVAVEKSRIHHGFSISKGKTTEPINDDQFFV